MNGDVTVIKNDNNSGTPAGGSFPLVVGTSSFGEVGKVVIVGPDTNLADKFGIGNLVDKLGDMFSHAGSNAGAYVVRAESNLPGTISPITKTVKNSGIDVIVTEDSEALVNCDIVLTITKDGDPNIAEYKYSVNGGDPYSGLIPLDDALVIENTGIKLQFSTDGAKFTVGDSFTLNVVAKTANNQSIMNAMSSALEVYDVPFVFITEPTDSVEWPAFDLKAKELFNKHRPTFFLCSTRMPDDNETLDDWVADLVKDSKDFASDNVAVCAGFGEIMDKSGKKKKRDISGIVAGFIMASDVNQSIAEVNKFPISAISLPEEFNSAHSTTLEDAKYITVKTYAGLSSRYIVEGRTMAEPTSDYKVLETLRTVYQAIRLARAKALTFVKSRVFPVDGSIKPSLEAIKAEITQYIKNNMVHCVPAMLTNVTLVLPEGQDINNQGLVFYMHLEGVPIIRQIKIYMDITYPST